jgi:hypothetical protein
MADDPIPGDIRDFILRHIDSIAQLEALLLLRADSGQTWNVARVAARLYTGENEIKDVLAQLCADGLLSCKDDVFQFECSPEAEAMVDRLAGVYRHHLIPETNLIHTKPRRIREFANAFKFRKDS